MSMMKAVEALVYVSLFLLSLWFFDVFKIIKSRILDFLKPKEAKVLIFGQNVPELLGVFIHEAGSNAWEYFIKEMKIIFFHLGGPWIANRVWRDYTQMDAIVYIVSARTMEQIRQQREELRTLVFQMEAFANVPFLILCIRNPGTDLSEEEMVNHLGLNNVQLANANVRPLQVFLVDKFNREHYLEGIKWLYDHLTNH